VDGHGLTRWRSAIILCQTSTVQDFTVQKFSQTYRQGGRPSLTLSARYFMKKEEAISADGIWELNPVFATVHTRLNCKE
jgi:hypothetical protein